MENKSNGNSLSIIIIMLLVILIGIGVVLIYNNQNDSNNKNNIINNNTNENNKIEENNKEEENNKVEENDKVDENKDTNVYKNFTNKFRLNRGQSINRIDDVSINEELGIGSLTIDNNGQVELGLDDSTLTKKYGTYYKLMSNVLTADVLEYGNGGFRTIIFIKEDGTLAAIDSSALINNKEIKLITNFGNIKNIVDVIQTSDEYQMTVKAIDIYGNAYNLINYLLDDNNVVENYKEENYKVEGNIYTNFVNKFKSNRGQSINRIDDVSINEELGIGSLTIDNNGQVELGLDDSTLTKKYGSYYKLMSNVLTADVLEIGNGGFRSIIFIKEDGTLAAIDASALINNKEIKLITNFGNAKNIVDVIQISDNNQMSINAIDIYGNTYNLTNYLIK